MMERVFLGMLALSGGVIIAGGLVALLIELQLVSRYAGITHTAHRMLLYENCIIAGTVLGSLMSVYPIKFSLGSWTLYPLGLCGGIFMGSWIIALTEVLDIIPILSRRIGLKKGFTAIILVTAVGKMIASLLFSYYRW